MRNSVINPPENFTLCKGRGKSSAALSTRDKERILCHSEQQRRISFYKAFNIGQVCPTDRTKGMNLAQNNMEGVLYSPLTLSTRHTGSQASLRSAVPFVSRKGRGESLKVFSTNFASKRKCAFTLAEVLITLGIIGVVAAMTLPTLIGNYNKNVVETKLKKFYTIMNQAVRLSEAEYGEFRYWDANFNTSNVSAIEGWWNKYFAPHIKTLKTETEGAFLDVYFVDNSKVRIFNYRAIGTEEGVVNSQIHLFFYPKANNKTNIAGKDYFSFYLSAAVNNRTLVEPYKFAWDGKRSSLLDHGGFGCRSNNHTKHYCTALIQYDGWKISDDYPFKF